MKLRETYTFDDINIVPAYSTVFSRSECKTDVVFCGQNLSSPLVPANMQTVTGFEMCLAMNRLGSIGILHRFKNWRKEWDGVLKHREGMATLKYAISVGVKEHELTNTLTFVCRNSPLPSFIVIDVANGNSIQIQQSLAIIWDFLPRMPIVAGNIATGAGATYLADMGVSAVKVGIGNGSLCETRIRTGVGVPQATAIVDVYNALQEEHHDNVQIISDGGVKTPGDVAKAIALGADLVMSGSLFAGTKETPLPTKRIGKWPNEQLYKEYAGSASESAKIANGDDAKNIEGNSLLIPYKGRAKRIFEDVSAGLRSAMSYVDARTIAEFQAKAEFVRVTQSGILEAHPHLMYQ